MHGMFEVSENDYDDSIRQKVKRGSNSGYLDEQYETTKDFPIISDYHFRIEDEHQIMELEKLKNDSSPINIAQNFTSSSSDGFRSRLEVLINELDHHTVTFDNQFPQEKHGFYELADSYDEDGAIESVLMKASTEELRQGVQGLSLGEFKPTFLKRKKKEERKDQQQMKAQAKALNKRFNKMTITDEDL